MLSLFQKLLDIPSPTFKEQEIIAFIKDYLQERVPSHKIIEFQDNLIIQPKKFVTNKKHISLIGHCDVVPEFFTSYQKNNKIYGPGASDMLASLTAFIDFLVNTPVNKHQYNISLIIYSREEGTKITENGLYDVINKFTNFIHSIDLAIIGEPTDNQIHLGCLGSQHYNIKILGKSCHSARPWQGKNALYKANKFIEYIAQIKEQENLINQLSFFDVIEITESYSEKGKTSIPGYWYANINYRFAPNKDEVQAQAYFESIIKNFENTYNIPIHYELISSVFAGRIIESDIFKEKLKTLTELINEHTHNKDIVQAKQAWTDVAQIAQLGVACFNFGAGLTSQAHKKDEYASLELLQKYSLILKKFLSL